MTNSTFKSTNPRRARLYRTVTETLRNNGVDYGHYYADERTSDNPSNVMGRSMRFWRLTNMNEETARRVKLSINRKITAAGYTAEIFETDSDSSRRVLQVFKA